MTSEADRAVAAAYSSTGAAWERGPGRIYRRLAEVLVDASPVPLAGRTVLDLGAGTGAASRAIEGRGGRPIAADYAFGMLATGAHDRPPAAVADARSLPFGDGSLDGVVAAFSLNHIVDPVAGLREAARVTAAGGPLLVSTYAENDTHEVKAAVEAALLEAGWERHAWYEALRADAVPRLATIERLAEAARDAGLDGEVCAHEVAFPELGAHELVEWRLGMAQHAPFVDTLDTAAQTRLRSRAHELLGSDPPMLVRPMLVLAVIV